MTDQIHISEIEMRDHLREACSQDPEKSFLSQVARRLADPAKPRNDKDLSRPHPLWLAFALISLLAFFIFVYFTFGRS